MRPRHIFARSAVTIWQANICHPSAQSQGFTAGRTQDRFVPSPIPATLKAGGSAPCDHYKMDPSRERWSDPGTGLPPRLLEQPGRNLNMSFHILLYSNRRKVFAVAPAQKLGATVKRPLRSQ